MRVIVKHFMIIALIIGFAKPAFALKIDIAQIAAKISDFTTKIGDTTAKITDGIGKVKEIATKGFNKEELLGAIGGKLGLPFDITNPEGIIDSAMGNLPFDPQNPLGGFDPRSLLGGRNGGGIGAQAMQEVASTLAKEQRALQAELDFQQQSATVYFEAQLAILDNNLREVENQAKEVERELSVKKREAERKKTECDNARDRGDARTAEICGEYGKFASEVTNLEMNSAELEYAKSDIEQNIDVLNAEAAKIGTEQDATYMQQKAEMEALEKAKNEALELVADIEEDDEWDTDKINDKLTFSDDTYRAFLRKYFYDPSSVSQTEDGGTNLIEDQAETERVMRARRQLILSTAIHLLQLSASVRRNIPKRTEAVDEMYQGVIKSEGELEAIGFYAGTRVENARTLLLYAKMQAVKLQYKAAKDLLITYPHRRGNVDDATMSAFNLSKYKLTQEYVEMIEEENREVRDLHSGVEE